jgi:hypothetical protein
MLRAVAWIVAGSVILGVGFLAVAFVRFKSVEGRCGLDVPAPWNRSTTEGENTYRYQVEGSILRLTTRCVYILDPPAGGLTEPITVGAP